MYEVRSYHCSYCRKYSTSKPLIKKHEPKCFSNPESKSCITCNHFTEVEFRFICAKGIEFTDEGKRTILKTNCHRWKLSNKLEEEYGEDSL